MCVGACAELSVKESGTTVRLETPLAFNTCCNHPIASSLNGEHHTNTDAKRMSENIAKNGPKCQKLVHNLRNIQKPEVLRHCTTNFYDMKPLKRFLLSRCQSPRLKNNANRRGNLAHLFLKRSQVLTVCRFIDF